MSRSDFMDLKEIRKAKGLSQVGLSKLTNIPSESLKCYEQGKRKSISLDNIIKLAIGLDVPISTLLDDSNYEYLLLLKQLKKKDLIK